MRQQGGGALGMVVVILLAGSALLHSTCKQLETSLSLLVDEKQYLRDFYAAQAALAWGSKLTWSVHYGWQCQTERQHRWRVCLHNTRKDPVLMRGEHLRETHPSLVLWRWMRSVAGQHQTMRPVAHGWIDVCPMTELSDCEPDVP